MNSGLTPFISLCFLPFFYSQAFKATTHTATTAVHAPSPLTLGGTIKMATKEEKVSGIVLIKDSDDKRRLKISSTDNDATTKFEKDATGEGYEHIGEGAVL